MIEGAYDPRPSPRCPVRLVVLLFVAWMAHDAWAINQRHFQFQYEFTVRDLPASARQVDVWVPVPWNSDDQQMRRMEIQSPVEGRILTEKKHGNRIWHAVFEPPKDGTFSAALVFDLVRSEVRNDTPSTGVDRDESHGSRMYLGASRLVPVADRFAKLARSRTTGLNDPLRSGRALYDLVLDRMSYDKNVPGWGRGDALRACEVGKGNCTDFHSLFIALARSIDIPARFWLGFHLPEDRGTSEVAGYHCWAEFWVPGRGWVAVDISEADKHPDRADFFYGNLDENRVAFSLGRDLVLPPGQRGPPLNYFVYPYVEVDGIPWEKVDYRFVVKDLPQTTRRPQKGKPIERRTIVADHAGAVAEKGFGENGDTVRSIVSGVAGE